MDGDENIISVIVLAVIFLIICFGVVISRIIVELLK